MKAVELISEALALIAAHWKQLLAVLVPIYVLQWGVLHLIERALARAIDAITAQGAQGFLAIWFGGVVLMLAWSVGAAILAVLWHRLVLRPGAIWPPVSAFGWYLWNAFKLSLLLAVLSWIVFAVLGLLVSVAPSLLFGSFWFFALAISTLGTWLWLRFGLILPAAAVGDDMTMVTSWFETEDTVWPIFALAVLQGVIWSAISVFDEWSRWTGAEFFLWPIPVLLGLAALSVLYRDLEVRQPAGT